MPRDTIQFEVFNTIETCYGSLDSGHTSYEIAIFRVTIVLHCPYLDRNAREVKTTGVFMGIEQIPDFGAKPAIDTPFAMGLVLR
jgi:hypothetical protein